MNQTLLRLLPASHWKHYIGSDNRFTRLVSEFPDKIKNMEFWKVKVKLKFPLFLY